jgi:hypothetical protein
MVLSALAIAVCAWIVVHAQDVTAKTESAPLWTIVGSPDTGTGNNRLASVSCPRRSACAAVGYYLNSSGVSETLAETWNGTTWSVAPSLNKGTTGDTLDGVSCVDSTDCTSVGEYNKRSGDVKTLIEARNGATWSIVASPDPNRNANYLSGISCTSRFWCVAVGNSGVIYSKTLVLSWDGKRWSIVPSPDVGAGNALNAVSCVSSTECVAVGTFETSLGRHETLIETWNGIIWSVTPSPNKASDDLTGVSCAAPRSCMAVGGNFNHGVARPLTESWNGSAWAIVKTPISGKSSIISLVAISCSGAASCIAVGTDDRTLVESWDGAKWSVLQSPNKGNGDWLNGVSCTSAGSCAAVGFFTKRSGTDKTLVESK